MTTQDDFGRELGPPAEGVDGGFWEERVQPIDWIPEDRRYDLLRDVDVLVALHRPGLETSLSLRTRFLEAFATGCPVVTTEGGVISSLLRDQPAGWVVAPGDTEGVARALVEALEQEPRAERRQAARTLAARYDWERVLEPLVAFCRAPVVDHTKEEFAYRPAAPPPPPPPPPPERTPDRLRRWLSAWTARR